MNMKYVFSEEPFNECPQTSITPLWIWIIICYVLKLSGNLQNKTKWIKLINGNTDLWINGKMDLWIYGYLDVWIYNYMVIYLMHILTSQLFQCRFYASSSISYFLWFGYVWFGVVWLGSENLEQCIVAQPLPGPVKSYFCRF